ncbi:MAG: hypothetical protein RI936_104 [Pseudomonadota bacterium]
MNLRSLVAAAALAVSLPLVTLAQGTLPVVQLQLGMHLVKAEVAATDPHRTRGLMFRESMPANQGMVFLFDAKTRQCMWMRNTLIPLSVAFIDDDGSIVNIEDMQPHTDNAHCSSRPVRYALEMNKGWFAQRALGPGSKVQGLPTPR